MSGPPSSVRFREPLEYPGGRGAREFGGEEYRDIGVKARGFVSQTGKPAAYPRQGSGWGGGRRNGTEGRLPMPAGVSDKKKKGDAKKTRKVFLMMVTALGLLISVYLFSSCSPCHRSPSGASDSSKQQQGFDFGRQEEISDPAFKSRTPLPPAHRSPPTKHELDSLHGGTLEGEAKNDLQQDPEARDTIDTESTADGMGLHLKEESRLDLTDDHLQSEKIPINGSGAVNENSASDDNQATKIGQTESESKDLEIPTDNTSESEDRNLLDKKPGSDPDHKGGTDAGEQIADPLNEDKGGLSGETQASGSVESEPQFGEKRERSTVELDAGTDVIPGEEGNQASTGGQSEEKTADKGMLVTGATIAEADSASTSEQGTAELETTERREEEEKLGTEVQNAEPDLEPERQPDSEGDGTQIADEKDPKLGTDELEAGAADLSNAAAVEATEGERKDVEEVAETDQDVTSDHQPASEQGTSEELGSKEGVDVTVGGEEPDVNRGLGTDESTDPDGKQGTAEIEASVDEAVQPETHAGEPSTEEPDGIKWDLVIKEDGLYPEQVPTGAQILQQPYAKRIVVSEKANLIYCPVPAAASTNWKYLIRKFEGFDDYRDLTVLHDRTKSGLRFLDEFGAEEIDSMFRDRKFVTFTFVRHPMHRLLSTYINKFVKKDLTSDDYKVFIRQLYGWSETSRKDPSKLARPAFEDFVRMALEQKDVIENDHWASQQVLCGLGSFPYDFVGKLENREEDSRKLLDIIGRPDDRFPDQEELKFPINGVDKLLPNFFTTELRNATATELAQDFELLKYSTDL